MEQQKQPLVTIGIPSFNRAMLLKRSIKSALEQDYGNIEVVVSDNASSDGTENVCRHISALSSRLKYYRQSINMGPTANFTEVLKHASGEFFMWLGDDDWIDAGYVASCVKVLVADPTVSLVSGIPRYYYQSQKMYNGKVFSLLSNEWWCRVIEYYFRVSDNGIFYGVMRTEQIKKIEATGTIGADWLLLANIISLGKAMMNLDVSVHRELGGATTSYRQIASTLRLSGIQAMFPHLSTAVYAWADISLKGRGYESRSRAERFAVAAIVFLIVLLKPVPGYCRIVIGPFWKIFKRS
jgi:glycosyltransferase involved in cell wall biosynthesis